MGFSVLMSLYAMEHEEYLREALDSVVAQSLSPDEVVMVADGPLTPGLEAVLTDYASSLPQLKLVRLERNSGLGKALNEGLKHCSYELVVRMDTDDVCFPNRFQRQLDFMQEHPEVDASSAWMEEFEGETDNVKSVKKVPQSYEEISNYIKSRNPLNHPAVIFRKSKVVAAGGYMHFPLFEDWYLWARMFKNGARLANIPECLMHFRTSPEMYKRRGGWSYAKDSARFQWKLHKLGLTSAFGAVKGSVIRGGVYIMPNRLREFVYSRFLRK